MRSFPHLLIIFWVSLTSIIYVLAMLAINRKEYFDCMLEKKIDSQCGTRFIDDESDEYYCQQIYEGRVNNISSLIYYTEDHCNLAMCEGQLQPNLLSNLTCIYYEQNYILVSDSHYSESIFNSTFLYILFLLPGMAAYCKFLFDPNEEGCKVETDEYNTWMTYEQRFHKR